MKLFERLTGRVRKVGVDTRNPVRNPHCTELEVDAWELSRFVVERLMPVIGMHPFPVNELMLLSAAVCWCSPSHIFEWGTHIGKAARAFYEITRYYGIACEIHSVDLPDDVSHVEHPSAERGRMVRGLDGVYLHQGDGVEVAIRIWRTAGQPARPLFFIDGDHAEDSVYRELSVILADVPSPVLLLHDTFYQSAACGYNIGPHRAIERALQQHPGRFKRIDSSIGLPGMSLLYAA